MHWNTETRYKLLLEINNAIATRKSRESLFNSLSKELHRHFTYDRLAIILYDSQNEMITYFAAADGVQAGGVIAHKSRPLADGAIARIAINSRQPAIFDDLNTYTDLSSVGELVKAGLISTMVFPLIVRDRILGTIHFSYKKKPDAITELTEVLMATSQQIAIAVDNMLAYTSLKHSHQHLQGEKEYLLSSTRENQVGGFFFASRQMKQVMEVLQQVANSDETILITGETGTGKDYLARLIHDMSSRRDNLFVKTNCPGLTSSLFESELFGHAKGAFTGADNQRLGRFELADQGTIFLDEIGELPIFLQAKLLQVLQERKFERVGESKSIPVDARIVAATNKDLIEGVRDGWFRQDLFYRLETVMIHVPPLRERTADIPLLVNNINHSESVRMNKEAPRYTDDVLELLSRYQWPGNVRELKNMVKRLIILQPGSSVSRNSIKQAFPVAMSITEKPEDFSTREQAERTHIIKALTATKGTVGGKRGAAKLLGMARSTLQYRIKKLHINPAEFLSF
ncbi:MAG: sigma 54-interacting transcriptional regulator [Desulfobacterales bacterium]|nr:sigma 54-interacting transcriptional regulator [Desulfobacterales bacterium]